MQCSRFLPTRRLLTAPTRELRKGWVRLAEVAPQKFVIAAKRKSRLWKRSHTDTHTYRITIVEGVQTLSEIVEKVFRSAIWTLSGVKLSASSRTSTMHVEHY